MKFNPQIYKRKSIRLKDYDYSQAGLYFITICCQNSAYLFGEIKNSRMILNDAGKMIEKWYYELEHKFPDIKCAEMIIMPNHFHCIIQNIGAPTLDEQPPIFGEHLGSPLYTVVQWFKTMTTNGYIRGVKNLAWLPFDGRVWQRNYYEHIIRNEPAYHNISHYILNNPAKWQQDKFNINP